MIFILQIGLSIMILTHQLLSQTNNGMSLNGLSFVSLEVTSAQFYTILLSIFWQTDIQTSIQMFGILWYTGNQEWPHQEIDVKDGTYWTWLIKVFFPNIQHFIAGLLALTNSFVIILQSSNVIDLFKDFTALILISEIDNLVFSLASKSYFGEKLKDETEKINKIQLVDDVISKRSTVFQCV